MKVNKSTIIIVTIIVVAILIFAIYYTRENDETTIVYCGPDKSQPVTIFKNPTKAFPAFANEYDVNAKGALNLLQALKDSTPSSLSGDLHFIQKINTLREQLNQDNIRMENLLKASFYSFNQNPCDEKIKQRYLNLIDTMTAKTLELERFKASISLPSQKGAVEDSILVINKDTGVINHSIQQFSERYFRMWKVECEVDGVIGTYLLDTAIVEQRKHQRPGHETLIIPD